MANEDILAVIEEAIAGYRPGGEFAKSREQQLAEKRATVIPRMQSQLVSRGLTGTTVGMAIPTAFEQEVAKPFQTETELLRSQRLMEAIMAKAGIMERARAQEIQVQLAAEERALQEKLANKQITLQEYANETARINALRGSGGGGGGGGLSPSQQAMAKWETEPSIPWYSEQFKTTETGGVTGAEVMGPSEEQEPLTGWQSYLYGAWTKAGQPTTGQSIPTIGPQGTQIGQRIWREYAPGESTIGKPVVAGTRGYWEISK